MSKQFIFEAGSYSVAGCYIPSIACLEGSAETDMKCHVVLVNSYIDFETEDEAVTHAENDLEQAVKQKQLAGSDSAFDEYLASKGYRSIEDFEIEEEGEENL